jgi:hypothetical protein
MFVYDGPCTYRGETKPLPSKVKKPPNDKEPHVNLWFSMSQKT